MCSFNTEKEKRAEKYLNNIRQMPDLSGKSALEIMVSFSDRQRKASEYLDF